MVFRVLVAGDRDLTDYPAPRAALDALSANRLPDVEFLTAGLLYFTPPGSAAGARRDAPVPTLKGFR